MAGVCYQCGSPDHKVAFCPLNSRRGVKRSADDMDENSANDKNGSGNVCYYCGKPGHKVFSCRVKKKDQEDFLAANTGAGNDTDSASNDGQPCSGLTILVSNLPCSWSQLEIKKLLVDHELNPNCYVNVVLDMEQNPNGSAVIKYFNFNDAKNAIQKLNGIVIEGKTLIARTVSDNYLKSLKKFNSLSKKPIGTQPTEKFMQNPPREIADEFCLFGLHKDFLQSLNIEPPLTNKVFVKNLVYTVDESKLHEVFRLAGIVIMAKISRTENGKSKGMGVVEFDHPIEAVQAVSMFNNQKLYNSVMKVSMQKPHFGVTLPEGLVQIGRGLGPNGAPLKGIRNYVDLVPIQEGLKNLKNPEPKSERENSSMEPSGSWVPNSTSVWNANVIPIQNMLLQTLQNNLQQSVQAVMPNMLSMMPALIKDPIPPSNAFQLKNDFGGPPTNMFQLKNDFAAAPTNMFQLKNDFGTPPTNPFQMKNDFAPPPTNAQPATGDMVIFSNLPSSVTVNVLREKMSEVGEIKFTELTGNGTAIVRFTYGSDAEKCLHLFHRSKVDGQIIEVKYV